MPRVERSAIIDAPIGRVWETLRDFNGHADWHPAVAESRIDGDRPADEIGAVRRFRLATGERLAERLLRLSDRNRSFSYAIVESEIPLLDYVAHVELKPVTDGDRTFWRWWSRFRTPPGRETELAGMVARDVYEAGMAALSRRFKRATPAAPAIGSRAALRGEAIFLDRHGGPEVLQRRETAAEPPARGEMRLRQTAIGVNFIDVYCRTGYFPLVTPPGIPGMEAAGEVVDVGPGVTHLRPGDRVAYACPPPGAYAAVRTMPAALAIPLPADIDDRAAAAGLLKGMTAWFLTHEVHPLAAGETVLVFAPAGGIGRMLVQFCAALGATVIGATSTPGKVARARAAGAAHVVTPGARSLEEQVRDLTGGRGVDVVYDAVGRDSFAHSVAALAIRGHLVSFGQASGDIGAREIGPLAARSLRLSRPNYAHYTDTPEKVARASAGFFEARRRGEVSIEIGREFPLAAAADAHRALEARATTGSTILIPGGEALA